jgi:hypothetical protein
LNLLNDKIDNSVFLWQRCRLMVFGQLGLDILNVLDIARVHLSGLVYSTNDVGISEFDTLHYSICLCLLQNGQGELASGPMLRSR